MATLMYVSTNIIFTSSACLNANATRNDHRNPIVNEYFLLCDFQNAKQF